MKTFQAEIAVMPHNEILDPQGKAVQLGLHNMGLDSLSQVRIGKSISLKVQAQDAAAAEVMVQEACQKLLANPIMEQFRFQLTEVA